MRPNWFNSEVISQNVHERVTFPFLISNVLLPVTRAAFPVGGTVPPLGVAIGPVWVPQEGLHLTDNNRVQYLRVIYTGMPMSITQAVRDWQNFYLLTGTAAATLIGLMFVAISLGISLVNTQTASDVHIFVTPTLIHFIMVLVIAAVLIIPAHTLYSLGGALGLVGLAGLGHAGTIVRHMWRRHQREALDHQHWIWRFLLPSVGYLLIIGTAAGLMFGSLEALDGLALAVILLLVVAIRNAWDLTLWIAGHRQE
jgi:hypothetical protein